jgi:arsenite/tail-anchored protein-transporting ATPase
MRVVLFTGKGGVGKTTAAAATATLAAGRGLKTLALSTDPAHSLADALSTDAGDDPVEVDSGLFVQQVDAQRRFERSWYAVRGYLLAALDGAGVEQIVAEELVTPPGAEDVLALLELREQARSERYDIVVVDCAPTAETIRLLALPSVLAWYAERLFPAEHRVARSLRPVLGRVAGLPTPSADVLGQIGRLCGQLEDVRELLTGPDASVRLVLTPEQVVVAEARRTLTSLALFGYSVDAVIANRVFPDEGSDPWRDGWVVAQRAVLAEVDASFSPLPVFRSPFAAREPVGLADLAAFADEMYGSADPFAMPAVPAGPRVERSGSDYILELQLPFAERGATDLARAGDDLVITVGGRRRVLALPSALRRCTVAGAALNEGVLRITFQPDPAQWMNL